MKIFSCLKYEKTWKKCSWPRIEPNEMDSEQCFKSMATYWEKWTNSFIHVLLIRYIEIRNIRWKFMHWKNVKFIEGKLNGI